MSSGIAGIILAAGQSSRFGAPKQLHDFAGEPLVRRIARIALASRLAQVRVVIGPHSAAMRQALEGLALQIVENPFFAEGQSTSVRVGLEDLDATAALFLPVDQPFLDPSLLHRLIAAHEHGSGRIIVPRSGSRRGAPVLFDRAFFPELRALEGDVGGRVLLRRHAAEIHEIEVENPLELTDIDTPEDLRRLERALAGDD